MIQGTPGTAELSRLRHRPHQAPVGKALKLWSWRRWTAITAGVLWCGGTLLAQSGSMVLRTRSLAASCAACHGTDGAAVAGMAMPPLAGVRKDDFIRQMQSFKAGARPATVMQQIAKGFSDAQIEVLAAYFGGDPAAR